MDKQEYKILSEEIMTLVANEQFLDAVEIADRIDWRKVRSFTMLQRISDLYKINRRFEEALDILFLAYDKNPNSKTIVYGICELYLDMGDLISALQYMSVYNKMAPKDVGGAILKYKVLELEEASYEDRVEQLEKICDMSYHAEWAYQLAYMYHRMGLATRCVETCDQLISWFGNGPFVIKAMELKMLHEKLTSYQQEIYNGRYAVEDDLRAYEGDEEVPGIDGEDDFHVKTIDMSKFNTINLQKVLAESMRDLMGEEYDTQSLSSTGSITQDIAKPMEQETAGQYYAEEQYYGNNQVVAADEQYYGNNQAVAVDEPVYQEEQYYEKSYAEQPTMESNYARNENQSYVAPDETAYIPAEQSLYGSGETFFDDKTGDIVIDQVPLNMLNNLIPGVEFVATERTTAPINSASVNSAVDNKPVSKPDSFVGKYGSSDNRAPQNVTPTKLNRIENNNKIKAFDNQLSYESDGQISLVVPDRLPIEKQITGQMNIVDVLSEWENLKRRKELRQNEETKQSFMEKTGRIFADYEDSKSDTIIAQIEQNKRRLDRVLPDKNDKPFDATAALNKTYSGSIWDEVNKAIEEDNRQAARTLGAGTAAAGAAAGVAAGVVAGAAVAGVAAKGAEAGAVASSAIGAAGDVAGAAIDVAGEGAALVVNAVNDTVKAGVEPKKIITKEMQPEGLKLVDEGAATEEAASAASNVNEEYASEDYEGEYYEGDEYGYYDEDGNWVEYTGYYDEDGNWVDYEGYYDEDGNWVEYVYEDDYPEDVDTELADANNEAADVAEVAEEKPAVSEASNTDEADSETASESESETEESENESENESESETDSEVSEENRDEKTSEETSEEVADENLEENSEETLEEASEEALAEAEDAIESTEEAVEVISEEVSDVNSEEVSADEDTLEETSEEEVTSEEALEDDSEETYSDEEYEEALYEGEGEYSENMNTAEINDLGDALEQAADQAFEETMDDINDEYAVSDEERDFSEDEQTIFADYLYSKKMKGQILEAIDVISLASYVGNVLISGDAGANVLGLAKAIIKEIQLIDSNFSANRVAKISGIKMNQKDIPGMLMQLANGALIIEKASKMSRSTLENLTMALENATDGIIVILTDTKMDIEKIIREYSVITGYFNARVDIIPMSANALAEYAKRYAYLKEYKIDEETGVLALHERISDLQIGEHHVTPAEIEEIVDEAIAKSKRPRLSTFIDILTSKRYDYEDMIILKEKDFRA